MAALAAAWLAVGAPLACAQTWSVGRPDPLPEFAPPPQPTYAPKRGAAPPRAAAPAPTSTSQAAVEADPGSTLVGELLVTARPGGGPAMWSVTRGGAEVVVVGAWSPLPHQLAWDQRRLASNLNGARAVLMPPEPKLGVFEGARLMLRAGAVRLPGHRPLRDSLPPKLAARYATAVALARADPKRYDKWAPAAAGVLLLGDYHRAVGLSDLKPGTTIARAAKAAGVPVRRVGRLGVGGAADAVLSLPPAGQLACLEAAVDQVIYERDHVRSAADAWASGRLRELRAQSSDAVLDRCLLPQTGARAVLDRAAADGARAIDEALAQGGRTVAVVDLRLLDRPDGVLDRLKAQGASVTLPDVRR